MAIGGRTGGEEALRLAVALVVEAPPPVEAPALVEAPPPASSGFGGSAHWGSFCLQLVFETPLVGRGVGKQPRRGRAVGIILFESFTQRLLGDSWPLSGHCGLFDLFIGCLMLLRMIARILHNKASVALANTMEAI